MIDPMVKSYYEDCLDIFEEEGALSELDDADFCV